MKVRLMHSVKSADEETGPIAQFDSDGFIFVAELMNCNADDFQEGKEYEVDVTFYCHAIYGIYKNKEDFHNDNPSMAEESYIPMGAFPANPEDKDWKPSPMNYINSTVDETVDNASVGAPENFVLFYGKVGGQRLDQIIYYPTVEEKEEVKPDYIVSGAYWAELNLMPEGDNN